MNKNRMILAIAGGVIGVAALVMAYLAFSAMSAKTAALEGSEEVTGLEEIEGKARTLSAKKPFPCLASVRAIESNGVELVGWQREVYKFVSRGDKVFPPTTSAAFKTFLVSDAKRLGLLPGAANGSVLPEGFAFGPFREYIVEGKMPAEAQLVELQRQWDDIASIIELYASAGVAQINDVQIKAPAAEAPAEDKSKAKSKSKTKSKSKSKAKVEEPTLKPPVAHTYVFTLAARPAALVKAINLFGTGERFTVVDDFSLQRPTDALQTALGGEAKQKEAAPGSRRSRRGRRAAAAEEAKKPAEDAAKSGVITDPVLDEPLAVTMTVTVYDFRSLEAANEKEEGAAQ